MNLDEKDLLKLIQLACRCFETLAPRLRPFRPQEPLIEVHCSRQLEYSGVIELKKEETQGHLCLTMPTDLTKRVLLDMGEKEQTEELQLDLVGEAASIIANNAREHFGSNLLVSVPKAYSYPGRERPKLAPISFVLPLSQEGSTAYLIIALQPNRTENARS